jgi:cytoskeletal protein RodZ
MALLGEKLRREREARGVSLEAISAQTRISVRFLTAIEENTPEHLPGGIFNHSFVRQYARFLGLDEEQAVRDYLQSVEPVREPDAVENSVRAEAEGDGPLPVWTRPVLAAATAVFVVAAVIGGWYLWREGPSNSATPSVRVAQKETATESVASVPHVVASPSGTGANPSLEQQQPEQQAETEATTTNPALVAQSGSLAPPPADNTSSSVPPEAPPAPSATSDEAGEELLLQISARSPVWVSITTDGEPGWQGTLEPNQRREVQASESIRLTVGNAGGVELTLNGKEIPPLGGEGEVRTVTLAAHAALPSAAPQQ